LISTKKMEVVKVKNAVNSKIKNKMSKISLVAFHLIFNLDSKLLTASYSSFIKKYLVKLAKLKLHWRNSKR